MLNEFGHGVQHFSTRACPPKITTSIYGDVLQKNAKEQSYESFTSVFSNEHFGDSSSKRKSKGKETVKLAEEGRK